MLSLGSHAAVNDLLDFLLIKMGGALYLHTLGKAEQKAVANSIASVGANAQAEGYAEQVRVLAAQEEAAGVVG